MKQTYSEKLRDPRWQKTRLLVLNRDNFACTLCGDTETELHIHHEEYSGDPWDVPIDKLKTHCKHCHKVVEFHKKDYADCVVSTRGVTTSNETVINSVFVDKDQFFITIDLVVNENIKSVITIKENTLNAIISLLDSAKRLAKIQ